jgi:hypothetical protein
MVFNWTTKRLITMNKHHLPVRGSHESDSSIDLFQNFRSFFRGFTVEDARALLSAHGLYEFEVDYLRTLRPEDKKAHK